MARVHQADRQDRADDAPGGRDVQAIALDRGYLTDGSTLFHVERKLVENTRGELLVELEDCMTLELIVCSVRSVAELGMRPVQPLTLYAA
jgi:hypothetical protein